MTDEQGNIRATYGYTPYGENDDAMFTGVDKPDPANPDKEMYNPFRYGGKRWDKYTESYDLGFRNYFPGVGRFMSPDSYTDSAAHKGLFMDGMTNSLYSFTDGNPVSYTDLDGHIPVTEGKDGSCDTNPHLTYTGATGCLYDPDGSCDRKPDSETQKIAEAHYNYMVTGKNKPIYNKQAKKEQTQKVALEQSCYYAMGTKSPGCYTQTPSSFELSPEAQMWIGGILFAITVLDPIPGDEAALVYFGGATMLSRMGKVLRSQRGSFKFGSGATRVFTSSDPLVGELATNIEARFPGKVVSVNKKIYRADGTVLTDLDIELDNVVIQVKVGGGKKMTSQLERTALGTDKIVVGYGPDLKGSIVKGAKAKGFEVFRSEEELMNFLESLK